MNDPGIDNGQGVMVPLEQFEHAWATSQHLIATAHVHDTHTILRDSYDDRARADLATNPNSLGVPSDPYQLEVAAQQRAQAMREREASREREQEIERERTQQLEREQRAREEEARREQLREEQRREEALREQQQREREQQQREEQQRREEEHARQRKEEELKAQQ
ncbi:MAG: hypothetical protein BWK78_01795 [Thiotrichaceae bacterium IS1]|nr:MAG: hypothetical protein BWK78_01795 [Thiotrichaceae bacterium IS1]